MPYTKDKPPDKIKALPKKAQGIWISAFNSAHKQYEGDEEKASVTAWAAVKKKYEQVKDGKWRAKADTSLGEIGQTIRQALYEKYPGKEDPIYISDDRIFPGYLIFEQAGQFFKLNYSLVDGKVTFADSEIAVEQEWVEKRSQQAEDPEKEFDEDFSAIFRMVEAKDLEGSIWEVTICEAGITKNGWDITDESLKAVAAEELFENIDVNLYELSQGPTHLPDQLFDIKSLLVKNKVGWLDNVRYVAGEAGKLVGLIHFVDSAKWLGKNLLKAKESGGKIYGLSYDAITRAVKAIVDNKPVLKLKKFIRPDSLDIVTRPAAGGAFNRAVASRQEEEDLFMKKEELWKLIEEKRPDLLVGKTLDGTSDEEVTTLARMAMEPQQKDTTGDNKDQGGGQQQQQDNIVLMDEVKKLRCEMALKDALAGTDFPDFTLDKFKKTFADRIFEKTELDEAIAEEKAYLAKAAEQFKQTEDDLVPASGIKVGLGSYDRACMAVDKTFGLTQDDVISLAKSRRLDGKPFFNDIRSTQDCEKFDDIPEFASLREIYTYFTGDPEVRGRFNRKNLPPELRAKADITSSTFTYVLGNTLARRLVKTYRLVDYGEEILISTKKPVKDFRTQEAVKVGYFPSIATVDPETEDYQEIATVTDEEATYSITQKGNLLTITRKTIINDDLTLVQKLVDRFGRAFRRTHGETIWTFWIDNSNCSDGTAWHTSGHGNLGATALSFSTIMTAYIALGKMAEKDSSKRIGLLDFVDIKPILIYPIDLVAIANTIVSDKEYWTGADDRSTKRVNPLFGKIDGRQLSHLSDTKDWGLILPGTVVDHLEVGYLNGREEPEFFVADSPQSEQVFVADKIRYKGRHEYNGTPVDYVGSYKAEVT